MEHHRKLQNRRPLVWDRSGSTLLWTLMLSTMLLLVFASSFKSTISQARVADRIHLHDQALALAEAGVESAMHELNNTENQWNSWTSAESGYLLEVTMQEHWGTQIGQFAVTVSNASSSNPIIESTGYVPSRSDPKAKRTVRVNTEGNEAPSIFEWAFFSYDYLKLGTDYIIDSYNSANGPYPGAGNANSYGNVGAMGDADFGNNIDIYGSMEIGGDPPGNDPNILGNDTEGNPNEMILNSSPTPPPPFPDDELAQVQASNDNGLITIDGNPFGGGTVLNTGSDAVIVMPPGNYYFTEIELGSFVDILVQPTGQVRIFINASSSGDFAINMGSDCNFNANTATPSNLRFFVKQGKVEIQSDALVYACFFAPSSESVVQSNTTLYGAFVGGSVEVQSTCLLHYDESLGNPSGSAGGAIVKSWTEVSPSET